MRTLFLTHTNFVFLDFKLNLKLYMQQPDSLRLVAEFHKTFKHPVLETPAIPDEARCRLRVALIAEELKEMEVAILEKDIVGIADALCDIQYVLSILRQLALPAICSVLHLEWLEFLEQDA